MNTRLNNLSDNIELISKCQAGFRKGLSTVDNIFVLFALISIYFSVGKKLFCTFVDFKSAFDTVWRVGLWQKLQKYNIKGKIFTVIHNMYKNVKSYVKHGDECSDYFNCNLGVKQGENLSPFLFSIFLNDLEEFFVQNTTDSLDYITDLCQNELTMYMKLFLILYADDTVLLSENEDGLKKTLDVFEQYCNAWKLRVNIKKTKIVIFSKRKYKKNMSFNLFNQNIDIQDSFSYLGIVFNYNSSFCIARKKLYDQAQKPCKHCM